MLKKNYKGRCQKRSLSKCKDIVRTYSNIQAAYADVLQANNDVAEFRCNVFLEGLELGEYTTDFVGIRTCGDWLVRECVEYKYLMKPMTVKMLDASREYWLKHGVTDWGIVINEKE